MDLGKEDIFKEACCYGDIESVENFMSHQVNINHQHPISGWTALHWACKRGQKAVVSLLLSAGADPSIENNQEQIASHLTSDTDILNLFSEGGLFERVNIDAASSQNAATSQNSTEKNENYLANSPRHYKVNLSLKEKELKAKNMQDSSTSPMRNVPSPYNMNGIHTNTSNNHKINKDIVLKIRVADTDDPDFIELEVSLSDLTFISLLTSCCEELLINPQLVERIRKLPNTRIRNDKDVRRFKDFQELEFIVKGKSRSAKSTSKNNYQSISNFQDQTILY